MANYCKVFLMGNIGSEIKSGATNAGLEAASFSLAVNKKIKGDTKTTWWKVKCFGNTAKTAATYLSKGLPCFVEGDVQLENWTGKDGKEHHQLTCMANQITFLGGKSQSQSVESQNQAQHMVTPFDPLQAPLPGSATDIDFESIPF